MNGESRIYYVHLPDNYDPNVAYPVVFLYHPLGGNGKDAMTMYHISQEMPDAIYVGPQGLPSLGGDFNGFENANGADEQLTRDIMTKLEADYCVDTSRYFATGFSYGGSMSFTAACNMSDVFRAIGAMAGAPISGAQCATTPPERPVAVWATHGTADSALPISMAEPMMDAIVANNGCSPTTTPVEPSPCVAYDNCKDGYPVVWCPREGEEHAIPGFAAAAIAEFFMQF